MALRGIGGNPETQAEISEIRERMANYAKTIRTEGKFKNIVHIGIGGSDLGPRLVADGFEAAAEQSLTLRFAENVDGASVNDAVKGLNPAETLAVVVSKSFGTQETKMNGESVRSWLGEYGSANMIAVTANRDLVCCRTVLTNRLWARCLCGVFGRRKSNGHAFQRSTFARKSTRYVGLDRYLEQKRARL